VPAILEASPIWGVGPGGGRAASVLYANKNIIFHSLYLQAAVEMGVAGMILLAVLLWSIVRRGMAHASHYGEIVPLLGAVSFMIMGVSVEALDIVGGMMLGIAFVGGNPSNLWRVRSQWAATVSRSPEQREPVLGSI
jgi:O-antigen ligase